MDKEAAGIVSNIREGKEILIDMGDVHEDSELVNEIDEMLGKLEPPPSPQHCIYRVPQKLRKVNEEAYTPHLVSIGPFHHDNENLKSMDQVKKRFMKNFFQRNGNYSLKGYIEFVKEWEGRIRECYSEHIPMESDEFVKMILVDGCFIIELLLITCYTEKNIDKAYSLPFVLWEFENIIIDLILLENQIPFFFLEELFSRFTDASFKSFSLLDLSLNFFQHFNKHEEKPKCESVRHFTDLVLTFYRPLTLGPPPRPKNESFQSVYSSTELNEAGVKFEASSSKCLFDIYFNNQALQIPSFTMDDNTEILFRNLMALELYCYPKDSLITYYVVFMDCLINTTRDVDLLVHKKIINNYLGDNKAVADLFNNLCINIVFDDVNFYFSEVCERLNAHYKKPWHKWKAMINHDYFRTPWHTASSIVAVTLLMLTFILTVLSIISTVKNLLPLRTDLSPPKGIYI